jgi:hypothetical protein
MRSGRPPDTQQGMASGFGGKQSERFLRATFRTEVVQMARALAIEGEEPFEPACYLEIEVCRRASETMAMAISAPEQ